jgi:hypothetical protein
MTSAEPAADDSRPVLPLGGHWTQFPALVAKEVAKIQARVDAAEGGHWHPHPEPHLPPGTVRTNVDGYNRIIGRFEFVGGAGAADANRQLVLYAHDDLTFLLSEHARLRAEVEQLRAERDHLDGLYQAAEKHVGELLGLDDPAVGLATAPAGNRAADEPVLSPRDLVMDALHARIPDRDGHRADLSLWNDRTFMADRIIAALGINPT